MNSQTGDMTQGKISRQIVTFAMPIIMGNIFQQFYNTADAMIVGRMLGNNAFAAVSVANPIMSVVLFFLVGLCMGVSVLLAQYFGAKRYEKLKVQLSTALISGVIFTLVVSAICFIFSKRLLIATNTPPEILEAANQYLQIVFAGLIFSFLYNFYASALRALGDSQAAFIYLVISSLLNIVLDILFIRFTPFGVAGAACATVLSQGVSSFLCIVYIYRKVDLLALKKGELIFEKSILKNTIAFSWAAALQQTFLYLGRMLIQGTINAHGTNMISGYNSALRLEAFLMAVAEGTAAALATFAGQNLGAGTIKRLRDGFRNTIAINLVFWAASSVLFIFFAEELVGMYIQGGNSEVIHIGSSYLHIMTPFYIMLCITSPLQAFFRGVGKIKITMIATFTQIVVRVVLSLILVPPFEVVGVCASVIAGWFFMLFFDLYQYRKYGDELKKMGAKPAI